MRPGYHSHTDHAWLERDAVDLWSIKCFVQVADRGTITHAADDLGITQPALTRRVHLLESELGVSLLERRPRGIRLTGPGRDLLEHARRILREVVLAEQHLRRANPTALRGRVVLGTSPTLAPLLLPSCVARARAECPSVTLRVVEEFSIQLFDDLLGGKVDVAVLTNPPHSRSLAMSPLLAEPFVVCTGAVERGMKRGYSLAELRRIPVIVTSAIRALVDRQLGRFGAQLAVEAEIDSIEAIRRMVLTGDGVTVLPVSTLHDDIVAGRCSVYPVDEVNLHRLLVLAHAGPRRGAAIDEILSIVRGEIDRLGQAEVFSLPAAGRGAAPRRERRRASGRR
jgi:LysR family nitrogen assimilation transcriptional regulator